MTKEQCAIADGLYRDAREATDCAPWMALWMAAIAIHESGWGEYVPRNSNNWIGYHCPDAYKGRWEYVETGEAGTGRRQAYRVFPDRLAMFRSLFWLVEKSGHAKYVEARELGQRGENEQAGRRAWLLTFSRGYCPADPHHGPSVLGLLLAMVRELEV